MLRGRSASEAGRIVARAITGSPPDVAFGPSDERVAAAESYRPRMDEPALNFDGVTLSPQKEVVRAFYKELWDHADKSLIPKIFHDGFHLPRLARADARSAMRNSPAMSTG